MNVFRGCGDGGASGSEFPIWVALHATAGIQDELAKARVRIEGGAAEQIAESISKGVLHRLREIEQAAAAR